MVKEIKNPCQFCGDRVKIYTSDDEILLRGGTGEDINGHYHLNCLPDNGLCKSCGQEKSVPIVEIPFEKMA